MPASCVVVVPPQCDCMILPQRKGKDHFQENVMLGKCYARSTALLCRPRWQPPASGEVSPGGLGCRRKWKHTRTGGQPFLLVVSFLHSSLALVPASKENNNITGNNAFPPYRENQPKILIVGGGYWEAVTPTLWHLTFQGHSAVRAWTWA